MKYEEVCWTLRVWYCKSNVMSNGHLSCMFILVRPIKYNKILQLNELQDFIRRLSSDLGGAGGTCSQRSKYAVIK